ncbi:Fringe glycosyltransferase [Eumeta japonica]|uniref:Fringe glycosyltransferase n=1 Tax=Eumeta variegata TaxID=151549 RepID=A0A4C1YNZ4_EUMVA|nr:Fringe glycosyltransferase [Eumeta japonica]
MGGRRLIKTAALLIALGYCSVLIYHGGVNFKSQQNRSVPATDLSIEPLTRKSLNGAVNKSITTDDVFISVKTTKHYQFTRLPVILKTWFQLAKEQPVLVRLHKLLNPYFGIRSMHNRPLILDRRTIVNGHYVVRVRARGHNTPALDATKLKENLFFVKPIKTIRRYVYKQKDRLIHCPRRMGRRPARAHFPRSTIAAIVSQCNTGSRPLPHLAIDFLHNTSLPPSAPYEGVECVHSSLIWIDLRINSTFVPALIFAFSSMPDSVPDSVPDISTYGPGSPATNGNPPPSLSSSGPTTFIIEFSSPSLWLSHANVRSASPLYQFFFLIGYPFYERARVHRLFRRTSNNVINDSGKALIEENLSHRFVAKSYRSSALQDVKVTVDFLGEREISSGPSMTH